MNEIRDIRVENWWKVFKTPGGEVEAVKGVDVSIHRGETFEVVGVSGSGKSTLLHIVGTLERPTNGNILYGDRDIFSQRDRELSKFRNREIGFVFQFHYLLPEFNALENTMMPCLINGAKAEEAKEIAADVLNKVGLGNRLDHRPGELSGGEQQRVAIARACVLKPNVILADEPTGNLDVDTGDSIIDLFLMLNSEYGITSVLVTHNLHIAKRLKRSIRLSDGKIVEAH